MPTTPRRKVEAAAEPVSSAPVVKNTLLPMPLVVKDNGAVVVQVVEVEKLKVKMDEVIFEVKKLNEVIFEVKKINEIIMVGVAEVDSSAPVVEVDSAVGVPPVPPVDMAVTHTLMMRQYDEMCRVMASEQEKTRVFIMNCAIFMVVFIFAMTIVVSHVYMLKEPAVCESPAEALPTVYDNMRCCARVFAKDTY
jgi:hypothetical protein